MIVFSTLLLLSAVSRAVEPTTIVREMSKCVTPVQIVYSGEKSKPYAERLASVILNHKDYNKKTTVATHSIEEYEAASHPAADAETVIAIIAQEETNQLNPKLGALFPTGPSSFDSESCNLVAQMVRAKAGQITFDGLIEAPKSEDLAEALDRFMSFSTLNWRDLKFNNQLKVNRVLTGGTNVLGWIPNWGRLVGNVINTVTYADPLPDPGSAEDQVYFWNRSATGSAVPPAFRSLTESLKVGPLTFAAVRQTQANGHTLALYTAPSEKVLEHLAEKFPNLRMVREGGFVSQVNDLRTAKTTLSLINGTGVDRDIVNTVGDMLDSGIRNRGGLSILQRGSASDLVGQDLTNQDVAAKIKSSYGVRWVFVTELSDATGNIEYSAENQCLSNLPTEYDQDPPNEPKRGRRSDQEWEQVRAKYQKDLTDYRAKKSKYEYEDQVQWRKSILKKSFGQIRVSVKLIDLDDHARVVWIGERQEKVEETVVLRSEVENMRGHMRKPRLLDCPRPENTAPLAIKKAGAQAVEDVVRNFVGESLLPNEDVKVAVADVDIKTIAVEPPIITINAGQAQNLKVGDHVTIQLYRDIVDPNTKEVIERVATDTITLEIVRVGKTSDCKAMTPKDAELLAKIKVGDVVQIVKK